jgi:hypothetical protein
MQRRVAVLRVPAATAAGAGAEAPRATSLATGRNKGVNEMYVCAFGREEVAGMCLHTKDAFIPPLYDKHISTRETLFVALYSRPCGSQTPDHIAFTDGFNKKVVLFPDAEVVGRVRRAYLSRIFNSSERADCVDDRNRRNKNNDDDDGELVANPS